MTAPEPKLRMAWIGSPSEGGGVGGMCRLFLEQLAQSEIELDVFSLAKILPALEPAFQRPDAHFHSFPYVWDWGSWYGRRQKVAFMVSFAKRLRCYRRLVAEVIAQHRQKPYDAVVQFSQGELFKLGRYAAEIPIILYPCVHAAGELHWCRKEEPIALRCERLWWRVLRNQYLAYRAGLQKRDYHLARGVIGMSRRFNRWVERDYGVPPERLGVVYHPIENAKPAHEPLPPLRPIRLLFVGRVSVRKGIDLLVQTIPSVLAAHPEVEVTLVGAGSLWSDYEALLEDLPRERCRWLKSLPSEQVAAEMRRSDILLVPSQYEPGGIVVGEALANGMIVVVSDEVGSAENLPSSVCKEFKAGDAEGFQGAISSAVGEVKARGGVLRSEAVTVAREQFDASKMTVLLLREVARLLDLRQRCEKES